MSRQVRETKAGKSISAYIITKKGEEIATVQAYHSDGGMCMVDVFELKKGLVHQGRASGYGYDKFAAALDGAVIDGVKIYDHCGHDEKCDRMLAKQPSRDYTEAAEQYHKRLEKLGMFVTNYSEGRWTSCFYLHGLRRLEAMGYKVFQAI